MKRYVGGILLLLLSSAAFAVGLRFDDRGPRAALLNPACMMLCFPAEQV